MVSLKEVLGKSHKGRKIDGSTAFAEALLDQKRVAVVPALAFGDDNYVRLSYATSRQNIVEGMARIKEFVAELGE